MYYSGKESRLCWELKFWVYFSNCLMKDGHCAVALRSPWFLYIYIYIFMSVRIIGAVNPNGLNMNERGCSCRCPNSINDFNCKIAGYRAGGCWGICCPPLLLLSFAVLRSVSCWPRSRQDLCSSSQLGFVFSDLEVWCKAGHAILESWIFSVPWRDWH